MQNFKGLAQKLWIGTPPSPETVMESGTAPL